MPDLESTVIKIREALEKAYNSLLKRAGFFEDENKIREPLAGFEEIRKKIEPVIEADRKLSNYDQARQKFIDEASFTLFNRLAGIKVMEARGMITDTIVTTSVKTGEKSTKHFLYISKHPEANSKPGQGINEMLEEEFEKLSEFFEQIYGGNSYGVLPLATETIRVINLINSISDEIWKARDIIGWIYQYYNSVERKALKEKKSKIDQTNVMYQSQQYTPDWVVKYIVDNTLGKYYFEMYPNSKLYDELDVPIPKEELKDEREEKNVEEIKVLDPACGSGNFLIYAFDLLYKMYEEQGYSKDEIPYLILKNNLYGIDIDDRAVQLAILNLYLKVLEHTKKAVKCSVNLVSTNFGMFNGERLESVLSKYDDAKIKSFIEKIWKKLKVAKFYGSLLDIKNELQKLKEEFKKMEAYFFDETDWNKKEIQILEDIKSSIERESIYGKNITQSMNFAEIIMREYDIVVTNPPYLDSSNMVEGYKKFVKKNYKDFDKNLYAAFMKRCAEFTKNDGYIGMITPQTFMFISSYEKMRKWLLKNFNIKTFVHVGLGGVFERGVDVDTSIFSMKKEKPDEVPSIFIKLNQFSRTPQEPFKKDHMMNATRSLKNGKNHPLAYEINQKEFSMIPGSPFVYWISDRIRDLFKKYEPLEKHARVAHGLTTGDNDRFLRFWWEVNEDDISNNYKVNHKKWVMYAKGGPYNKWYGNLWWVINWEDNGRTLKDSKGSIIENESYYFREGLTYSHVSSLGFTTRYLPSNCIFDVMGSSMFVKLQFILIFLALISSKSISYAMNVLNPTAAFQVGDLKKIPIPPFDSSNPSSQLLSSLADENISIKKELYSFHIIERDFKHDPVSWGIEKMKGIVPKEKLVHEAIKAFFIKKAELEAKLLLNEAKVDTEVFKLYELLPESYSILDAVESFESGSVPDDLKAVVEVISSEGVSVGWYPSRELDHFERKELKNLYLSHRHDRGSGKSEAINGMEFGIVEEISSKLKVSPLRVVEEIKKIDELPSEAVKDVVSEHIQAMVVEIMREDKDGIVPLESFTREKTLFERLVQKWNELGIGDHYDDLENLLGTDMRKYLLSEFFKVHTKRFKNRPVVWHLMSNSKNFNFFVLHHKWNYDKMLAIKSVYLSQIKARLNNVLASKIDPKERAKFIDLIHEVDKMSQKIEELSDANYRPDVDDGVAKNIAYLQKWGLIKGKPLSLNLMNKMLVL